MQIEQISIRPERQILVVMTRNSLGTPDNFTIPFDELDPAVRLAVNTVIAAVTQKLPQDIPSEVLAEIQELEARLSQLRATAV